MRTIKEFYKDIRLKSAADEEMRTDKLYQFVIDVCASELVFITKDDIFNIAGPRMQCRIYGKGDHSYQFIVVVQFKDVPDPLIITVRSKEILDVDSIYDSQIIGCHFTSYQKANESVRLF